MSILALGLAEKDRFLTKDWS